MEAIACREALALAEDLQINNFVVASDPKQIISDTEKGTQGAYGSIIREIKHRSAFFNCNFLFESRATNVDADRLAKFLHSLD